jgi:hypothetical protein|tara:strand:+ start:1286 stop:2599 length:1314 start_codon:yes stop_codon:yes gene_type:complete
MNSFSIIISTLLECLSFNENGYIIKAENHATEYVCKSFLSDDKFDTFDKNILNPYFITGDIKEKHYECFFKAQNIYHILCRVVRRYKVSKSIRFDSTTDLCLNDISNISALSIVKLYVDNTRVLYTFRISDLIQLINAALTYNSGFFAEPQTIKNPYTNIPFTNTELYNIYYSIKYSHFEMPYLFQQYLKHDFSLIKFTYLNEQMLREIAIDDYCKSATNRQKYTQLIKMLVEFSNIFNPSNIDPDFPKEKLVVAFSHLLIDYVTFSFSLISVLQKTAKQKIRRDLTEFKKYNPMYGRKLLVRQYKGSGDEPFVFGDKTRSYTIKYRFIDTVITRPPDRLKKRRDIKRPNRINLNTLVRRPLHNRRQNISNTELDQMFSFPIIRQSENIITGTNNITIDSISHNDETDTDAESDAESDDDPSIVTLLDNSSSDDSST